MRKQGRERQVKGQALKGADKEAPDDRREKGEHGCDIGTRNSIKE